MFLLLSLHTGCPSTLVRACQLPQGNAVIIDIRSAREKEAGGVPDIPNTSEWQRCDVE